MKDKKMDMQAKKDVLKELLQMAMDEMKGKTGKMLDEARSMKKVAVMAPDKEGLEEGLDKAKDVLEEMPMDDEQDMEMEEDGESEEDEMGDDEKKMLVKKLMKK